MNNPVLILGAGKVGKLALDIFSGNDVLVYGFLDDDTKLYNTEISEVLVLGELQDDKFLNIIGNKTEAFVAIEHKTAKEKMVKLLVDKRKSMPVNAIHNKAVVAEDAIVGNGILIAAGAIVNPWAKIGNHSVLLSGAIVDSGAQIGEFVEIGAGAVINSEAEIGDGAFIGSGAIIVSGVKIGKNARIGAGSVVIEDIKEGKTVFGNPALPIDK
ncbi:sugar O-acyltransferase, sialic acid O-acetyltransferase NeuD family [Leadbetterella byssophila DSM 17132]|uniref:Sugar O-acyltransferase, sialic acid O-acetyltransferase NeuD family n=1 Tax=Leadbetterella byssophila (strain DSM 17132 / JCM 16389 / KACC 11308 / NBRC 106382 / 4M15) TaxID=649349 RepID=E4RQW0_LEAB4|nr:NeuD/PglB/VioB family sugar acetyltransferase [Leadbetterella byssophila]ADQ18403.1 sugar O-acyltransferase, sialic acid O-acetyltransferase NeuD family [Leadbetterella byssophila DSM 17132]